MEYQIMKDTVFIRLPERINADNAETVEKEIFDISIPDNITDIVLDASELRYISSMGLRILLKMLKHNKQNVKLTEVSSDVYGILEATGFDTLLNAAKALRYVNTEKLEELGRGMYGSVYRLDDEKILKVFHGLQSRDRAEEILKTVRTVFMSGIPTIIPYETVRTDAGIGMVFEKLGSKSMADLIHQNPGFVEEYSEKMVKLARIMATTEFEKDEIENRKDMLHAELKSEAFILTDDEYNELASYIDAVPDRNTGVHGDFHAGNVYILDGEALMIDMDDFALGHPIWDMACLYRVYPYLLGIDRPTAEALFGLPPELEYEDFYFKIMHMSFEEAKSFWESFVDGYFSDYSEEQVKRFMETSQFYSDFMVVRFVVNQCIMVKDNPKELKKRRTLMRTLMDRMREKNVEELIGNLDEWK